MTKYDIWEYPEANLNSRGRRRDLFPEQGNFRTIKGAVIFFCDNTGWNKNHIIASGNIDDLEFYHKKLGYIGGMTVSS